MKSRSYFTRIPSADSTCRRPTTALIENPQLHVRKCCPACGADGKITVELPYDEPPISTYLQEFCANHPDCSFEPLAGTAYRLAECPECGSIYQAAVPGPAFLEQFYAKGLYGRPHPPRVRSTPIILSKASAN